MNLIQFVELPNLSDDRGGLVAIEANKEISFNIKRVYYIFATKSEVVRGCHAHKQLQQLLICVSGSCRMVLDDGMRRESVILNAPDKGLLINNLVWREMHEFSEDCILLVLASEYYDENDYIRDYDAFLREALV